MGGAAAVESEVAGSGQQAGAEVVGPHAVDHHAGCEWIPRVRQPGRERLPAVAFGRVRLEAPIGGQPGKGGDSAGGDGLALPAEIAAIQYVEDPRVLRDACVD